MFFSQQVLVHVTLSLQKVYSIFCYSYLNELTFPELFQEVPQEGVKVGKKAFKLCHSKAPSSVATVETVVTL